MESSSNGRTTYNELTFSCEVFEMELPPALVGAYLTIKKNKPMDFNYAQAMGEYNSELEREYNSGLNENTEKLLEFVIEHPAHEAKNYREVFHELDAEGWVVDDPKIKNGIAYVYVYKEVN